MAKGHKTCNKCGADNGCRALACQSCKASFGIHERQETQHIPPVYKIPELYKGMIKPGTVMVYTPCGKPPTPLDSLNDERILDWCHDVRIHGLRSGRFYTNRALAYWANTQYLPDSEEGQLLGLIIRELEDVERIEVAPAAGI